MFTRIIIIYLLQLRNIYKLKIIKCLSYRVSDWVGLSDLFCHYLLLLFWPSFVGNRNLYIRKQTDMLVRTLVIDEWWWICLQIIWWRFCWGFFLNYWLKVVGNCQNSFFRDIFRVFSEIDRIRFEWLWKNLLEPRRCHFFLE